MDYRATIVSAAISIIVAAITGWITAKQSYSREIKKSIHEERQKLYIEIFELLEQLQRFPYLIFNDDGFVQRFRTMSARTKLYASKKVLNIISPFIGDAMDTWKKYNELYRSEAAEQELHNRQYEAEETDGISAEQIEYEFDKEAELFMDQHIIPNDRTAKLLDVLSAQIRSELRTK